MIAKYLPTLALLGLLVAAGGCAVETHPPGAPEGTVYDGPGATYAPDNSAGTKVCGAECLDDEPVANGFKATVSYENGDTVRLENVSEALVVVSAGGVASFTTPNLFDGDRFYSFSYGFRSVKNQYAVVDLQVWGSNPQEVFVKAGFDYGEGQTNVAPAFSTEAEGILTVQSVSNDRIAVRHQGTALLDGETVTIEAEFNVPLQEQ